MNELQTMFTEEHNTISELYIKKIESILGGRAFTIGAYSLSTDYGYITESLKVQFGNDTLELRWNRKA